MLLNSSLAAIGPHVVILVSRCYYFATTKENYMAGEKNMSTWHLRDTYRVFHNGQIMKVPGMRGYP